MASQENFEILPTGISAHDYVAAMITVNIVTAFLIAIRLTTNLHHHRAWYADDYLCLVGLANLASYSATSSMMNTAFNTPPKDASRIVTDTRLAIVCIFTASAAMYFAKLPVLIFVMRTFNVQKWVRWTGYFLMVFTGASFLAASIWTAMFCDPNRFAIRDTVFLSKCARATFETGVSRNSLSLVVDVVIFILPLPSIIKLNLSRQKKIQVSLVFMTGSLGIIASAVSFYYQIGQEDGATTNYISNAMISTILECSTLLIVSCTPSLRLLWVQYLRKTRLAHKLGLGLDTPIKQEPYNYNSKEISTIGGSARRHYHGQQSKNSSQTPITVTTHAYIELDDAPRVGALTSYTTNIHGGSDSETGLNVETTDQYGWAK